MTSHMGRIVDVLRLFEPFYSTEPNGMGLGLSISRSIVEARRGRIKAIAQAEGGMTFRITLPLPIKDLPL
ncbi:MAG: hypothetical protein KF818_24420 [Chelatococcus sp.]|nr:hypothetical protein [Chelatococcus sp. HY11]MBX3545919.1 hypothetical protein [Chelatococcus sp.]CAH1658799.1 putative Histidine kinase [Hyphomicrobiales bacterium]CAH1684030.1 putative Histidine kinase [Hyphomicrobiales bacterium]